MKKFEHKTVKKKIPPFLRCGNFFEYGGQFSQVSTTIWSAIGTSKIYPNLSDWQKKQSRNNLQTYEISSLPCNQHCAHWKPRIIWRMSPANDRRRYNVTPSLIGWVHSRKWTLKDQHYKLKGYLHAKWWPRLGPIFICSYLYCQTSSIKHVQKLKCFSSRLAVVFSQSIETKC